LIPERLGDSGTDGFDAKLRATLEPLGAEFISVRDVMCSAEGCLTRVGDEARDITASDQVHLTEKGSVFLIQSVIDQVLGGQAMPVSDKTQ
jgi:hypothetical protein